MKKTIITILLLFVSMIVMLHHNVENIYNPNHDAEKNGISKLSIETLSKPQLEFEVLPTLLTMPMPTPHTQTIKSDFSNVIFIGDSITFGFINAHNTPVEKDHVYAKIGAHVFEGSSLLGNNIKLITNRCNGSVDYIFIMFGANDYGYNMTAYKNWYKELIEYIKEMFPNAKVVLQSVMPMNSTNEEPNRDQEPQKLNQIIKTVAIEENIRFMDVSNSIVTAKKLLAADGLHFKPEFYPLWINVIRNNEKQLSQ